MTSGAVVGTIELSQRQLKMTVEMGIECLQLPFLNLFSQLEMKWEWNVGSCFSSAFSATDTLENRTHSLLDGHGRCGSPHTDQETRERCRDDGEKTAEEWLLWGNFLTG